MLLASDIIPRFQRGFVVLFFCWVLLLRLQVEVANLHIVCQNGHGVLVQLMQALESLEIDLVNTHHTFLSRQHPQYFCCPGMYVMSRCPESLPLHPHRMAITLENL
jgi:hypothetical protein